MVRPLNFYPRPSGFVPAGGVHLACPANPVDQREYLKLAETEDNMWYFRSLHRHVRRELEAGARPGGSVLDAGCGTGGLILRLRELERGWKFSGIDFMPLACKLAAQRCGPSTDVRVASITELPFDDASFEAVVSADVICQVGNPEVAVAELYRVLKPGGLLVINVPAYQWMWSYHDETCQTQHRYGRGELGALLQAGGGTELRITHWNSLTFPAIWAKRKIFRTSHATSDVRPYPIMVEWLGRVLMGLEHRWIRAGRTWAWGTSLFAVARKPDRAPPAA